MIRAYYALKLGSFFFAAFIGQWAILHRTAYPRPIFASVCQNCMAKSADLIKGYSGIPNHALIFDGGL
jgi:hypothetical protein